MVDASRLEFGRGPEPVSALAGLEDVCARTEDPDAVRGALSELSWSLLDAALGAAPRQALARAAALAGSYQHSLRLDHQRVLAAIQLHAGQVSQGVHT